MQFVHQALTWGFLLALAPVLIHLINLVRRRRVQWAAMDFLLKSYKKHRRSVWLKQLALLLTRMAIMVVAVAMLAQWIARGDWFALFGGQVTHHYIILDDSFSMSERTGGITAFDRALESVAGIARQAASQDSPQRMTLLRHSRAAAVSQDEAAAKIGLLADLNAVTIDPRFDLVIEEKRRTLKASQLSVGALQALETVRDLIQLSNDEQPVVYLLSDYRQREWDSPVELKSTLDEINDHCSTIQLIRCEASEPPGNLSVSSLVPGDDIRVAGVGFSVNVTITNHGSQAVQRVPVSVRTTYYDPSLMTGSEPGKLPGRPDEPPSILIDDLGPGESTTRQVVVSFPREGQHVIDVSLPDDGVAADNRRWSVLDVAARDMVLAIDGTVGQRHAFFLTAAFQPGPRAVTGIQVDTQSPAFLRDITPEKLATYRAVYLLDVDRLDDRAIENLESYVRAGGGLAAFCGSRTSPAFYNTKLYRDGQGLFPLPLLQDDILAADPDALAADLVVTDHPLFQVFLGENNPFINLVIIDRFIRPTSDWKPGDSGELTTSKVIARLRNGSPLVVEKPFGNGRVVTFLTTLAPEWNNWANDPSFVVVLLKLQSYISAQQRIVQPRFVGSGITVPLSKDVYRRDLTVVLPGESSTAPIIAQRTATETEPNATELIVSIPGVSSDAADTSRAGLYEIWPATLPGANEVRRFAFNVDANDGELAGIDSSTLISRLDPVAVRVRRADDLSLAMGAGDGLNRSLWLMLALVALLAVEQLLAFVTSYHPPSLSGAASA